MSQPIGAKRQAIGFRTGEDGGLDVVACRGALRIAGLRWSVLLADGRVLLQDGAGTTTPGGDGVETAVVTLGNGAVEMAVDWRLAADHVEGRARIRNAGAGGLNLDRVVLGTAPGGLAMEGGAAAWSFYKMGWNVAAASGFLPFTAAESSFFLRVPYGWLPASLRHMMYDEGTRFSRVPGDFQSEWMGAFAGPGGDTLVAGFAGTGEHFSQVFARAPEGGVRLEALLDGALLPAGSSRELEPIRFQEGGTPDEALQGYARAVAARHGARVRPIRLWCSWYSGFYDRVTRDAFLANARQAREEQAPVDFFQLDDGYQHCIGDWTITNDRFPSGLEDVARSVRESGYQPGVWTAPFAVSRKCEAFRSHPDWVVRDAQGRPVPAGFIMGKFGPRNYYGLDTTNPQVIDWIEDLYRRLRAMGWCLFKVDFLTAASVPGIRHDPGATRAQAYRKGLQAVRAGVGEDAWILSGIGPVLGNAGVMDIQRLGPDTAFGQPAWRGKLQRWGGDRMTPGLYNNIAGSLGRSFTDGILWSGDGDALIQQGLPAGEATTLAVVALLCGGTLTVGHDYRKGPFDERIVRELAGRDGPAWIPDRADGPLPRQVVAEGRFEGRPVRWLALANLEDAEALIAPRAEALPDGGPAAAMDVLEGTRTALSATVPIRVPAHGVKLFRIERS